MSNQRKEEGEARFCLISTQSLIFARLSHLLPICASQLLICVSLFFSIFVLKIYSRKGFYIVLFIFSRPLSSLPSRSPPLCLLPSSLSPSRAFSIYIQTYLRIYSRSDTLYIESNLPAPYTYSYAINVCVQPTTHTFSSTDNTPCSAVSKIIRMQL